MKLKGSKKIVSLFLAVLMVVSSVPAFALSASAAVNTSTDVSALKTAMDSYEEKMTSGKIYTNMANAYTYYIAAQKAYDACVYGYNDAYVAKATTDLTNATNAMTEWTPYTASKWGTFDGEQDEQATEENYKKFYKNVLYSTVGGAVGTNTVNLGNRGIFTDTCYDKSTFYYPETVLMYDGTTDPQMGVIYSSIFDAKTKYDVIQTHQAVLKSNYGGLKLANERWKGTDTRSNFIWMIQWAADDIYSTTGHESYNSKEHGKTELYWSNVIKYDATADGFASGEYLKTYKPTFSARMWNGKKSDCDNDVTSSVPIYVFNYRAVIDKVKSLAGKIPNVKNYLNGGLSTAFATIDKLTTDPNSFFTSSNDIKGCVDNYSNAINNVDSQLSSATADAYTTQYQALRDAIANAQTVSGKTADSTVAYGKAIKAGRDFFANLATYTNNGDNAESLANAIKTKYNALANVDTDDAYSNFDAAVTVVNAMDKDAFKNKDEVTNQINSAKAQVYTTLTDSADIEAYTLATGTAPTADLKNSTNVDKVTKDLLNFASNPDESLINRYTVSVGATVFNKGTETNLEAVDLGSKKYGEIVDINVNDLFSDVNNIADKTISWTVQYKNSDNETISNQKVRNDEPTISVKATANIVVTALVTDETKTEETTGYTVKFLDIYGKLADVAYTTDKPEAGSFDMDSYTVGDKTYTPEIPFYTLKGFTVSSPDSNNVVTVRPTYTTEIRLGVTVYNGTAESSSLKSDNTVQKTKTVTVSTTVAHIGWAVVKDNKYQIVAYTDGDYQFVALGDDNSSLIYTPLIEQAGGYAVYNSDATTTALTASNVYQFENNSAVSKDKVSDDAYLNAKIAAKAPFTYVEEYTTLDVSGTTMYRYYVRITAGSDAQLIGFGVEADSKKYSLTSKNDLTGQYSASFRSAKSEFKAYVSYSFAYSYGGTDYNISTADYATL